MKHARSDYDRMQDPEGLIPENEPVFLIRAQDKVGAATVLYWANQAAAAGADPELIDAAIAHARRMKDWPIKKVPNAPKGAV